MKRPPASLLFVFALLAVALPSLTGATPPPYGDHVKPRGSLANSRVQFGLHKKGHVAFMGGSITEMNGYRPMVCEILKKRFPDTAFQFTDAGISSTCSTTGAFRLGADVLAAGPVDLFFVEFAVNDDQDAAHTRAECIRGLEGIVRQMRRSNPKVDIVVTFFVNETMLKTLETGATPLTIEAHETVARHYELPTINLAWEVSRQITAGSLTWEQYGGVHPAPHGNAICAGMIDELFNRAWREESLGEPAAHPSPAKPLDPFSYENGRFIDPRQAQRGEGWTFAIPDWDRLPGSKRSRFTSLALLCAETPGAEMTLQFEGSTVGAYLLAGPDAGMVEASVDGAPFQKVDLLHRYSSGLHYPRTVLFGTELPKGHHTLKLRLSAESNRAGHAMRVMQFVVN
ncbi:MAG: SGNH/GDSL hydrolase family protein [Verrucomicrobiota bacterium]